MLALKEPQVGAPGVVRGVITPLLLEVRFCLFCSIMRTWYNAVESLGVVEDIRLHNNVDLRWCGTEGSPRAVATRRPKSLVVQ